MRVLRAIVLSGSPEPVPQHWVTLGTRRYRIDLAYPEFKVAIEVDAWDAHRSRTAFDRDRVRENDLVVAGWRVLRFTSNSPPSAIGTTVAAALDPLGHDLAS
jgi:very-short-patch-repair endonuclease